MVLLIGTVSLARRSWPAWLVFVVPILLAMLAASMRRYPFHGRLILELVPAFFLLIGLGTRTAARRDRGTRQPGLQGSSRRASGLSLSDGCVPGRFHAGARLTISTAICTGTCFLQSDPSLPCRARARA